MLANYLTECLVLKYYYSLLIFSFHQIASEANNGQIGSKRQKKKKLDAGISNRKFQTRDMNTLLKQFSLWFLYIKTFP